jgi:hypothetical protein
MASAVAVLSLTLGMMTGMVLNSIAVCEVAKSSHYDCRRFARIYDPDYRLVLFNRDPARSPTRSRTAPFAQDSSTFARCSKLKRLYRVYSPQAAGDASVAANLCWAASRGPATWRYLRYLRTVHGQFARLQPVLRFALDRAVPVGHSCACHAMHASTPSQILYSVLYSYPL